MSNVELKAYKAGEITFKNNVQSKVEFKLGNKISHNVLSVKVVVNGIFKINTAIEKEFIHVETFKELFPYAKALVTTVTANAGIPPIIVKNIDIEKQEIYRWNLGGKQGE